MKTKDNYYYFLVSTAIIFFNAIAYNLCLNSMQTMKQFSSPFTKLMFEINMISNSLFFPFLLLLIIYIFRNIFLILILHFFVLIGLLTGLIYYKYFLTIPNINLISQIPLLPYISEQIFFQLFGIDELIISGCIFLSMGLSFKLTNDIRKGHFNIISKKKLFIFFLIVMMVYFSKGILLNSKRPIPGYYLHDSVRALKLHGFTAVYLGQFIELMRREKRVVSWPGKINSSTQDIPFRSKIKKNVIILQVESLDTRIIDYRLGSKYAMPYLHLLKEQSAFFKYFFKLRGGGGSSDAELASLTSLIPLRTHSGFRSADYQRIIPLNRVLAEKGYHCVGIHANTGRFFDRTKSYALMGFNKFFDQEAFYGEAAGWHSKDEAFFQQTIKILRSLPQPFFSYIITMQGHGPFHNYSINPDIFDLDGLHRNLQNYILTMREVDQALSVFITQLEKYGFLKNTILMIYGDSPPHLNYSGPAQEKVFIDKYLVSSKCHIPLFIIDPDISPGIKSKVGSHIDIGPTVLDLLGIEEPDGWLGSSLLQPGIGKAVLDSNKPYVLINQENTVAQDYNSEDYFKFIDYSTSILDP